MMEASQRGAFGALYGDLFEQLSFNDDESEHFMDLLMVRQMSQMELGMKMMSGNLSDEEQKAMQKEIKATAEEVKEEMKIFLNNDEDYADYEFYEQTIGERMMLSQMDQSLSDNPISDESYNNLLEMMHDEKKNFKHSGSDMMNDSAENLSPDSFSEDNIKKMLSDTDRLNEIMIVRAREILTPLQQAEYEKTIKQFAEMQKSQMEMSAGMFGNKK